MINMLHLLPEYDPLSNTFRGVSLDKLPDGERQSMWADAAIALWELQKKRRTGQMWLTLMFELIKFLGPLLMEAFRAWLERRLREKAEKLNKTGVLFGTDAKTGKIMLLKAVRADLWPWQIGKKRAIDKCIEAVETGRLAGDMYNNAKIG